MNNENSKIILDLKENYKKQKLGFLNNLIINNRLNTVSLNEIDQLIPQDATVVDIGCGHGVFSNFIAKKNSNRKIYGYDIDKNRIETAKQIAHKINNKNCYFYDQIFQVNEQIQVDVILLYGVLCLIPFQHWGTLFQAMYLSLKKGGFVIFHDIKMDGSVKNKIHVLKENIFNILKITKGDSGLFVKKPEELKKYAEQFGFNVTPISLNTDNWVHLCLNYKLSKI